MEAPAVSGAETYQQLCLAAKNEEKRQAGLRKRQQYLQAGGSRVNDSKQYQGRDRERRKHPPQQDGKWDSRRDREDKHVTPTKQSDRKPKSALQCHRCGVRGYFARECKVTKTESGGTPGSGRKWSGTRQIQTEKTPLESQPNDQPSRKPQPEDFLASSTSEEEDEEHDPDKVRQIHVADKGSQPRCARVLIQGVPMYGIVDSGADITIIGGNLFKKVAAAAKLRKRDLKKPDRVPRTYDRKPFTLDGRMDLEITFGEKTIATPVYIKMDATEQLLLSEGVCRQLGIITYHPDVQKWRGVRARHRDKEPQGEGDTPAQVPTVRVCLVQSVHLLPLQQAVVQVQVISGQGCKGPVLVEPTLDEQSPELQVGQCLLQPAEDGLAQIVVVNPTGFTQSLSYGLELGAATEVSVIEHSPDLSSQSQDKVASEGEPHPTEPSEDGNDCCIRVVCGDTSSSRRETLAEILDGEDWDLPPAEKEHLREMLLQHHSTFSLSEDDRGETDLIQFGIDTGDSPPKKQQVRRTPFAARQEIARQLKKMQQANVIQPSNSPWASPVVLVRKKDGSLRFCIDYRALNAVTKPDTYPLPRMDDLLDQLGKSKHFSTLDLASGYWQIPMHPDSQEKTAFTTHQGLFEFQVMPFGLRNAPAVFQRLMQRVLMPLNPEEGPDFVSAYMDDVLVFSESLQDHIDQLQRVLDSS